MGNGTHTSIRECGFLESMLEHTHTNAHIFGTSLSAVRAPTQITTKTHDQTFIACTHARTHAHAHVQGWDEGCLTMQEGEIARITMIGSKGYGPRGFPAWGIPPNAALCFEIEILSIQ
eukprot:comp20826_c0_seq1/m.27482 comp20826_c0_seq1/g.27482  ORF comp20826_c0_seq1/g.27482 comp20826_c0_seq1/m.27482 type:complete len:118 (-) comp20826_c0_seq1:300-653(-)